MKKIINDDGWWHSGGVVKVDSEIQFDTTTNPEIDSTGGGFIWKIKTAIINAWKLRDDTKGTDILSIDTNTDTIETKYHTIITNEVTQITFADSPYTASWGDDLEVNSTSGAVTINLPTAVDNNGKWIYITKIDSTANDITVDANSTETINGSTTLTLSTQWETKIFKSNGTNITTR